MTGYEMKAETASNRPAASSNTSPLEWTRFDWACLLLLAVGTALAVGRFWLPGVSSDADMLMGIYRVFELDRAWQGGIFFPRLGADLNFTYGAPLFQFYPPLASYGALIFHKAGLGLIEASKAMFSLSLLLGGLGVFVYARWLFSSRKAALVSGMVYLFSPYLLTNVYERGAAAESLALALLPWVFWAVHHLLIGEKEPWIYISAMLIGLLVLAHNITAMFALPAILLVALVLGLTSGRFRQLGFVGLAIALGLGLSLFYWLPALAEVGTVRIEASMLDEAKNVVAHLVPLTQLVQESLVFDYWGELRFHPAFWQVMLGALGIVAIPFQDRTRRLTLAIVAGLWLLTLFLQLSYSRFLWESLPLIRFIQFPWRLLGLGSFCLALLAGSLFLLRPLRSLAGSILALVLLGSIVYVSTARLSPEYSPIWYRISSAELGLHDLYDRGSRGFALFSDYLPGTVQVSVSDLPRSRSTASLAAESETPAPLVQVLSEDPFRLKLLVGSQQSFDLRLHRFNFPGWRAYLGSYPVAVESYGELGLVSVPLPSGVYPLEIRFEGTPLRTAATVVSVVCWIVVLMGLFEPWRRRTGLLLWIVMIAAVVAGLLVFHGNHQRSVRRPILYPVNYQNELRLVGHDLEQTTWTAGEQSTIVLYWLVQSTPMQEYRVRLELAPADGSEPITIAETAPLLGLGATTRWEPGELITDAYSIFIGEDVFPGRYDLVMTLYQSDLGQNLKIVQSPASLPGERAILSQLEVVR